MHIFEEQFQDLRAFMDSVQGTIDVFRWTEDRVERRFRNGDKNALAVLDLVDYVPLPAPLIAPLRDKDITRRNIEQVAEMLNSNGSFLCWRGARWKESTNAVTICQELIRSGMNWVQVIHVKKAQEAVRERYKSA